MTCDGTSGVQLVYWLRLEADLKLSYATFLLKLLSKCFIVIESYCSS
jgi:hypothetical protein